MLEPEQGAGGFAIPSTLTGYILATQVINIVTIDMCSDRMRTRWCVRIKATFKKEDSTRESADVAKIEVEMSPVPITTVG